MGRTDMLSSRVRRARWRQSIERSAQGTRAGHARARLPRDVRPTLSGERAL